MILHKIRRLNQVRYFKNIQKSIKFRADLCRLPKFIHTKTKPMLHNEQTKDTNISKKMLIKGITLQRQPWLKS